MATQEIQHTDPTFPAVVFGDFVCPWSYATLDVMDRLAADYGLRPWWRPHLLRPDTPREGVPMEETARRAETEKWLAELAPETTERMRYPTRMCHTHLAFQGLEFADRFGKGWGYVRAVFDELWLEGSNIGEPAPLLRAADRSGLDAEALERALAAGTFVEKTSAAARKAVQLKVTATPTIILGRVRVEGWHYYDVLASIISDQRQSGHAA